MTLRSLGRAVSSSHHNGTTLKFVHAENWCYGQSAADAQFRDSIEVSAEPDCPFKALRPKQLNEFGIPEKKQYRSEDVARALGISTDLSRWRFQTGKYLEVPKDSAGRRIFSIRDVRRLASTPVRRTLRCRSK
jgi:hypothetical protein